MATNAGEPAIVAAEVTRDFDQADRPIHALRGASLEVHPGEIVAVMGPSGSGKTTFLNCLVGLDQPTTGTVKTLGSVVSDMTTEEAVEWRRSRVAMVFQDPALLPHLTAWENVELLLRVRGVERRQRRTRTDEALAVLGLEDLTRHRPAELSGGQRQRVSLARAIAARPDLIIADEPTGQLDSDTGAAALACLTDLAAADSTTIVMSTHDLTVADAADRTVLLTDGRITNTASGGSS